MSSLPVDERDPDLVQPNRVSCVKELESLTRHPDKLVQLLAKHIVNGAPSNVKLPRNLARKRPVEAYRESRYGFLKNSKQNEKNEKPEKLEKTEVKNECITEEMTT